MISIWAVCATSAHWSTHIFIFTYSARPAWNSVCTETFSEWSLWLLLSARPTNHETEEMHYTMHWYPFLFIAVRVCSPKGATQTIFRFCYSSFLFNHLFSLISSSVSYRYSLIPFTIFLLYSTLLIHSHYGISIYLMRIKRKVFSVRIHDYIQ